MPDASERRSKFRTIVGPEHTLRFVVKGHCFQNVRITNLSTDGCFATVQPGGAGGLFSLGTILENLTFEHPDLPAGPITGTVSYVLGGPGGRGGMEFLGLGIHFAVMAPDIAEALAAFVSSRT